MNILIETYYILLPIIATALIGWVGVILKEQKKNEQKREDNILKREKKVENIRKANSTGIMLVLRYMLKRYHSEYMLQGKMTYSQYKGWIELYEAYSNPALGGNSIAKEWNEDIENLEKTDSIDEASIYEKMLLQKMK